MEAKHKKKLTATLKIIATCVGLYFVFKKVPFDEVLAVTKKTNLIFLFLAFSLFVFSKVFSAYRLNKLFQSISINLSQKTNLKLYLLGMFYNLFLPGGIGGDGYKLFLLKKKFGIKSKKILLTLLIDRLSGLLALGVLIVAIYFFLPVIYIPHFLTVIISIVVLIVFYFLLKKIFPAGQSLYPYLLQQSLLVQLFQVACSAIILIDLDISLNDQAGYLFLFLISSLVSIIPFTIGGLGARELTFVYGSPLLNLEVEVALTLSLLFYATTALTSLTGLFYSVYPINELKEESVPNKV